MVNRTRINSAQSIFFGISPVVKQYHPLSSLKNHFQPRLFLGRQGFFRGDNVQCYPLVQSIFKYYITYILIFCTSTERAKNITRHNVFNISAALLGYFLLFNLETASVWKEMFFPYCQSIDAVFSRHFSRYPRCLKNAVRLVKN